MSQLRRIILLHTHLTGVVEIDLDDHTNFCGTNASGKTTLQRLIPVFYGEQPNRVVPKTRKKFDEFYLPYSNSYIIYEYERDNGSVCQVVLTRKSEGGVDYRLVAAPYHSEWYLQDSAQELIAYSYAQWSSAMRLRSDVQMSAKISATSEYRSIIQNDVGALRASGSEIIKLRRLATQFGLVSHTHKLRHIEKLVSAVHAKEGKMDTLKSMLAAIFEEDGVTVPTTKVKNAKAREWITQMRQSMRLERLQQDFAQLTQLERQLDGTQAQLGRLLPRLDVDHQQQMQQRADWQTSRQAIHQQLQQLRDDFSEQQQTFNGQLSKVESDLQESTLRLDDLQQRYERYEQRHMWQLQQESEALPLQRETLAEIQEQYQLMLDLQGDLAHQLDQQKAKLAQTLQRLSETNHSKTKQLQQQKDALREQQQAKQNELEQAFQERLQTQQMQFHQELSAVQSQLAVLQNQLTHSPLSAAELDELHVSERRLEQAQMNHQQCAEQLSALQQLWQQAREMTTDADGALSVARQQLHRSEMQLQQLQRQLTPDTGSLRAYLQQHYPGWEQNVGKVIDARLLERADLQPNIGDVGDSLFGVQLALGAIDPPDYAQDEAGIRQQLQQASQDVDQARARKQHAEKALRSAHDDAEVKRQQVESMQWQLTEAGQNIEYARDARVRLQDKLHEFTEQRQVQTRRTLEQTQQQSEQLQVQQRDALQALKDDHHQQMMEFQVDWQSALQVFDEQFEMLERQLEDKRHNHHQQLKELEQAFNEELSDKGIDPHRIAQLKQRQQQLSESIKTIESRQDELTAWQRFIQLDWQQLRPKLLEQETQLKQQIRQLNAQLSTLKSTFNTQRKALDAQRDKAQEQLQQAEQWLNQLTPLLSKMRILELPSSVDGAAELDGDLSERLARANQALAQRSQCESQLRAQLEQFESILSKDAGAEFLDRLDYEKRQLLDPNDIRLQLKILADLLRILRDQQQQLLEMGENIGGDLQKFFTVFRDINRRITQQSSRLSDAVADDLTLEGIDKSEVRIISTIDELGFWQPLQEFAKLYDDWSASGKALPSDAYLDALADVVDLLRADEQYRMESLLRLELHLSEGGSELVIKNDRQLLESSSHGMAYLILCKYLLAFTRLMRADADVTIHWPIDEIGTLAYHNVEKLFHACSDNHIVIVGAFPNPESDVLLLFKHRYLLAPSQTDPNQRQLKRIQPKMSRLAERLIQTAETNL
ncbi:ATP-binding protein [Celerinatantimonas yamalensis]|uniref:ATP-binding protein n=1 Tax=Celerinatantimonas yamalensis TaxID=559956 RepID=A0ABW9GDG0_9GAMM